MACEALSADRMSREIVPFSGGLSEDCRLFLSNGTLIKIKQLMPGDSLLTAEGKLQSF